MAKDEAEGAIGKDAVVVEVAPVVTAPVAALEAPLASMVIAGADAARQRERAVLALLRGGEAPLAITGRFGVEVDELFDWLERYRECGRGGLAGPAT